MPVIHTERFLGIAPKVGAQLLPDNMAQMASNAKLWSEKLRPHFGLSLGEALTKDTGYIQTLYRFKDDTVWLHWTQDVDVVRGPIANDTLEKTYFTGTDFPRVTEKNLYDDGTPGSSLPPASYILGIPIPTVALSAAVGAAGTITGTVDYVFTFVRKWSDGSVDEGPPSPISNQITLAAQKADLTVIGNAPIASNYADYGITHKRIYRLNAGFRFFVAEIAIGTLTYTDDISTLSLGDAIESTNYLPPPDAMIGLIAMPNGITAGFKDNVVYLSEPYRPWAWPIANRYTVNWPIVAIGNVGTSVIVATSAYPFIGRGIDPAAYSFKRDSGRFPCVSKRSMASSDIGALWATPSGLAASDGVQVVDATKQFLTRDEWAMFYPETLHAVIHDGRYHAWYETGEVTENGVKLGGGILLDWSERAFFTTLTDYVQAAYSVLDSDALWVVKKNPKNLYKNWTFKWEGDPTLPFVYEWKSRVFVSPGRENFAFAQIIADYGLGLSPQQITDLNAEIAIVQAFNAAAGDTDGSVNGFELNGGPMGGDNVFLVAPSTDYVVGVVSFKYWADGLLKLEYDATSNEPFPMPSGFTSELHEFQVAGAVECISVTIATSMEELATR
jgi:hypothetical protein